MITRRRERRWRWRRLEGLYVEREKNMLSSE